MLLTSIYALSIYILVSGQAPPCLLITFLYHFFSRLATPGCHRSSLSNLGWFLITICELDFELKLKFDWPPNLKAGKFGDIRFERRLQSCNPSFFCISFTWSIQIAGRSKWSKNSDSPGFEVNLLVLLCALCHVHCCAASRTVGCRVDVSRQIPHTVHCQQYNYRTYTLHALVFSFIDFMFLTTRLNCRTIVE